MIRNAKINNQNIWDTWGAQLTDGALEALLTPPPMKEYIESESRLEHGTRITAPEEVCRMASRELSLSFILEGNSHADYLQKYLSFVDELKKGKLALEMPVLGKVYNLYYLSSGKYGSYGYCRAKITVKLKEPNPDDRTDL